jgi:hypothetical protein
LAFVLIWLLAAVRGFGADPVNSVPPIAATNYVLVTNVIVVTVTNYVVTTNAVLITSSLAAGRTNSALPDLSWVPPEDSFDWIQLNTGEWLKGRIKAMQERQIEFFSEKLSDLTFDWKDVRQVRSPRTIDVLFVDGRKVSGSVTVTPEQVAVGGAAPYVAPRDQLQSLTPGGSKERDYWSADLSVGLALQTGNTKSVQYNAQVDLQRRTPATRLSLDYIGNVSTFNGDENANNHRVNTEFDLWLSRRFYLVLPSAEYYTDPFQNLAHRVTAGGGVGYDLIDRRRLEWPSRETRRRRAPPRLRLAAGSNGTSLLASSGSCSTAANTPAVKSARPPTMPKACCRSTSTNALRSMFRASGIAFRTPKSARTSFNPSRMIFASSSGWECISKAKAVRVPPEGAVAETTLDFGRLLPS